MHLFIIDVITNINLILMKKQTSLKLNGNANQIKSQVILISKQKVILI